MDAHPGPVASATSKGDAPASDSFDPVDRATRSAGAAADACPSCDAPGAFVPSRRHRFNPFGGVTCLVLAFWAAFAGLVFGFGYLPALALVVVGVALVAARRTALVCQVCGFVRP